MENTKNTSLEAPVSVHIDAYYKGFHVGVTQRDSQHQTEVNALIHSAKDTIDNMVKDGWECSWNKDTSKSFKDAPEGATAPQTAIPAMGTCPIHGVPYINRSGISQKTGKPYSFWTCPEKNADGSFCPMKPKPVQLQNAVPVAQSVQTDIPERQVEQ